MNTKVVSVLRSEPVWISMASMIALAAYVLQADIRGEGIKETLLFKSAGYFAFPIFYGCAVAAVVSFARMLSFKDGWLTVSSSTITVGSQQIPLQELRNIEVRRNWVGFKQLVFHRVDGTDFVSMAWMLARPLPEALSELQDCLPRRSS